MCKTAAICQVKHRTSSSGKVYLLQGSFDAEFRLGIFENDGKESERKKIRIKSNELPAFE
jgi:hypothetical protein